jgi:hypothetical protein
MCVDLECLLASLQAFPRLQLPQKVFRNAFQAVLLSMLHDSITFTVSFGYRQLLYCTSD